MSSSVSHGVSPALSATVVRDWRAPVLRTAVPKIGFDRYIQLDWAAKALAVRAGLAELNELDAALVDAGLSSAARKKTRTVLNRLWLEPRDELKEFAKRGVSIYMLNPDISMAALCWGMTIAAYPFFGRVAELVGRLSGMQGDCSAAEIHRRMSETYGEREGTRRMTNMILQSQANWGAIERKDKNKRIVRLPPEAVSIDSLTVWLIEALVRYAGKPISCVQLQSQAVLFPFTLQGSLSYLVSSSPYLRVNSEGLGAQSVALANRDP